MINNHTVSLVIPCYNEEEGLKYVLKHLPENLIDEVVVVDNNSNDRTVEVAKEFRAKVIVENKQGYGSAYKAGFKAATQDVIVTMDGDGTYPVEQIKEMVEHLINNNFDFVSGSRFPLKSKDSMFLINQAGNIILTKIFNFFIQQKIQDCESGMWIFYRNILNQMNLKNNGIPLSVEIKIEAILNKKIKFTEVNINYKKRLGIVKLRKWKDGWGSLMIILFKPLEIFFRKK